MTERRSVGHADRRDAERSGQERLGGSREPGDGWRVGRIWPGPIPLAALVLLPGGPLWWMLSASSVAIGGLPVWVVATAVFAVVMPVVTLTLAAVGWHGDDDIARRCGVALVILAGVVIAAPLAAVVATEVIGSRGSGAGAVDTREWVIRAGGYVNLVRAVPLGLLAALALASLGSMAALASFGSIAAGRSRTAVVAMAWGATLIGTIGFVVLYGFWSLGTSLSSHTQMPDEVGLVRGLPLLSVPLGIITGIVGGGVVPDD